MTIGCIDLILLNSSRVETFEMSKNLYEIVWQLDGFFYLIYSGKTTTKLSSHMQAITSFTERFAHNTGQLSSESKYMDTMGRINGKPLQ